MVKTCEIAPEFASIQKVRACTMSQTQDKKRKVLNNVEDLIDLTWPKCENKHTTREAANARTDAGSESFVFGVSGTDNIVIIASCEAA